MKVVYQGHSKRTKQAKSFWLKVAKENNQGISPEEIAKKYINPKTGKHYTRSHIYWILERVAKGV